MRIKRAKKYKRIVNHFKVVYKFKPPYRVIVDGGFLHYAVKNGDFDLKHNLAKIIQEQPLLVMTKCIMRELEHALSQNKTNLELKKTLNQAKLIHKSSCLHPGGIIDPDECILHFINKKNEEKVFVGTNDQALRNKLRNLGTVPIFFFRKEVLIMDTPTEAFDDKMKLKELLKMEPTKHEKKYIAQNKETIIKI